MKNSPSVNIVPGQLSSNNEIQHHSYCSSNTLTGTDTNTVEGTFLFDYNSIKLKYKNDFNYNRDDSDTNLTETMFTQLDDRKLELSPRSQLSNAENTETRTCEYDIINQKPTHTFDLHEIIQRYGNHPNLLELVLSSKVEEDRRKTEEAKLKQKELEYLIIKKEGRSSQTCSTCNSRKNSYEDTSPTGDINALEATEINIQNTVKAVGKGKSKQSNPILDDPCSSYSNLTLNIPRIALRNDNFGENDLQKEELKRRREEDEDLRFLQQSSKDMDYFSTSSTSSYISPAQPNLLTGPQQKRRSSLNQIYSLESSAAPEKKNLSAEPVRQLQSLDYLNSRRTSGNYHYAVPYRSSTFGEKVKANSLPINTLPPIGMSYKSQSSNDSATRDLTRVTSQPAISTSAPSNEYRIQKNGKYRALSTLDSFEASIMETLPFDNNSDKSSLASLENVGELNTQTNSMTLEDDTPLHLTLYKKKLQSKPTSAHNNKVSSSIKFEEPSTKKLLLPPNPTNPQIASSLSNRPRRRRREMQAITMIIETKEFPYNDDYVWKNNGNTIHKSNGQKSIYYKCSNSIVGCPVNKTVTFRDNGEYLIKYRGNHLEECNKIERIVNV